MNRLAGYGTVLVLALCIAFLSGCGPSATPAATPNAPFMPTHAQPKLRTIKLWLGAETLDAEMAVTAEQEATGMMFRTNRLAENEAMVFPLPYTTRASFWMTNCPLPLGAAYISPDGVIQEIHAFRANDDHPVFSAGENIRFVLETAEGWFERHHITTNMVIRTEKGSLMETFFPGQ